MTLALGTVQFGMPYGKVFPHPEVNREEVGRILDAASNRGVDMLDTAIGYGSSEEKLGSCGVAGWRVVSKLPEIPLVPDIPAWIVNEVKSSLGRMKLRAMHGVLLHKPQQLLESHGVEILEGLQKLKDEGLVRMTGISVYTPHEVHILFDVAHFDIVQAPFNLIDRRLLTSGCLDFLKNKGVEVHVRSVFLQGLLLMDSASRRERFAAWNSLWVRLDEWVAAMGLTNLEACLGCVNSVPGIDYALVGVNSLANLEQILDASDIRNLEIPGQLLTEDVQLLNPGNWIT